MDAPLWLRDPRFNLFCGRSAGVVTGTVAGTGTADDGRKAEANPLLSHSNSAFTASTALLMSLPIQFNLDYLNTNIPDLNLRLTLPTLLM